MRQSNSECEIENLDSGEWVRLRGLAEHVVEPEPVLATHWATVSEGKIVQIADGYPPHELHGCQFALTPQEHKLLSATRNDPDEIIQLAQAIKAKIIANGS